jgi:cell division protein FtsL
MGEIKKKKRISWIYILSGGMLERSFFTRHIKMIAVVVSLLIGYINNNYYCIAKLREIDRLQEQLKDVKIEALSMSARLTGNTRPSQVEDLVKRQGLGLERAKQPPYKLHK